MASSMKSASILLENRIAQAAEGNAQALFELGVIYSTGAEGSPIDLVEAHKFFNLAALQGREDAIHCRCDISEEMTAREISEAQKEARAWLRATERRAA